MFKEMRFSVRDDSELSSEEDVKEFIQCILLPRVCYGKDNWHRLLDRFLLYGFPNSKHAFIVKNPKQWAGRQGEKDFRMSWIMEEDANFEACAFLGYLIGAVMTCSPTAWASFLQDEDSSPEYIERMVEYHDAIKQFLLRDRKLYQIFTSSSRFKKDYTPVSSVIMDAFKAIDGEEEDDGDASIEEILFEDESVINDEKLLQNLDYGVELDLEESDGKGEKEGEVSPEKEVDDSPIGRTAQNPSVSASTCNASPSAEHSVLHQFATCASSTIDAPASARKE
jgi:hypothetical protein